MIQNKKDLFSSCLSELSQNLNNNQFTDVKLYSKKTYSFSKHCSSKGHFRRENSFESAQANSSTPDEKIELFNQTITDLEESNKDFVEYTYNLSMNKTKQISDKFSEFVNLKNLKTGEPANLLHSNGEILLIILFKQAHDYKANIQPYLLELSKDKLIENNIRIAAIFKDLTEDFKDDEDATECYSISLENSVDAEVTEFYLDSNDSRQFYLINRNGFIIDNTDSSLYSLKNFIYNPNLDDFMELEEYYNSTNNVLRFLKNNFENLTAGYVKDMDTKYSWDFEIKITKIIVYNQDGKRILKKFLLPVLNYNLELKVKEGFHECLNKCWIEGLNNYFNLFFVIKKNEIDFSQNFAKFTTALFQSAKENNIHSFQFDIITTMDYNTDRFKWSTSRKQLVGEIKLLPEQYKHAKLFSKSFEKLKDLITPKINISKFEIECLYSSGDKFEGFSAKNIKNDSESQDFINYDDYKGKILFILFWSARCPFSIYHIEKLNEMFKENKQQWQDKIHTTAICLDSKDCVETILNGKNLNEFEDQMHFINPKREDEVMMKYRASLVPKILIINKEGLISYLGHPNDILTKECIEQLLSNVAIKDLQISNSKAAKDEAEEENLITKEEVKNIKMLIESNQEKLKNINKELNLNYVPIISFLLRKMATFNSNNYSDNNQEISNYKLKTYYRPTLNIIARNKDINKIIINLDEMFEGNIKKYFSVNTKDCCETVVIEYGKQCEACKISLENNATQFYCKFCNVYFCQDCGEKIDASKQGNNKLLHPCNMVWISVSESHYQAKNMEIDLHKFGRNEKFDDDCFNHRGFCNGCNSDLSAVQGPRYICLSCNPGPMKSDFVDLCHDCLNLLKSLEEKDSQKYNDIKNRLASINHEIESHILYRIYFSNGSYYHY